MKTPINDGILQSDLDVNGFDLLNFSGGGGSGAGLPVGGTSGQLLQKQSGTDFDADWATVAGGAGGTARKFDVKSYGALGNGTTDDTSAIQFALSAIPLTGGVLYFPPGQYKYTGTTLTLDRQITVEGDGGGVEAHSLTDSPSLAITTIDFNSSTGVLFTVAENGCVFKNLELRNTSGTTPTAGSGIRVLSGGDRTLYQSITVNGFYVNIDVEAGWMQTFNDCYIVGPVLYGLRLRNTGMPDYGDHSISNCQFLTALSRAATSAIKIESGGGVKIINTKINSMGVMVYPWVNGIELEVAGSISTSDLLVSNCSIENYSDIGIKGTVTNTSSSWWNILITGNQFNPGPPGNQYGINFTALVASVQFRGLVITGNWGLHLSGSTSPFISLTNCNGVIVTGNGQFGFGALLTMGAGVEFADCPVYIGRDARLVAVSGGAKLEARNTATDVWVEAARWTNP